MKAIILAAGRGSRLKHLTEDKPKCLYEFAGKPLLQWQKEALQPWVSKIGVVVGYKSEMITMSDIHKISNDNWQNTNMISSLLCAEQWIGDDDCIISYSDIVYSKDVIESMIVQDKSIVLPYYLKFKELWTERFNKPLDDLESFKICNGIIEEIGGRVNDINDVQGQYMGLILFQNGGFKKFIGSIRDNYTVDQIGKLDFTSALSFYIKNGGEVFGTPTEEMWLEFDTVDDADLYKKYENLFCRQ